MGQCLCRCGARITDTPFPGPEWFSLLPKESDFDAEFQSRLESLEELTSDEAGIAHAVALSNHTISGVQCPNCKRLLIWWVPREAATFYVLEDFPAAGPAAEERT